MLSLFILLLSGSPASIPQRMLLPRALPDWGEGLKRWRGKEDKSRGVGQWGPALLEENREVH